MMLRRLTRNRNPWTRWAALLALPGVALAQAPSGTIVVPERAWLYLAVAPGETREFAFEIRDAASNAAGGTLGGELDVPVAVFAQFTFAPVDPVACAAPTVGASSPRDVVRFPFAPTAGGANRICRYRVTRAADAVGDLGFFACLLDAPRATPRCSQLVRIGSLPDQELAIEGVGVGAGDANLVQLRLINRSSQDVTSRIASTDCHVWGNSAPWATQFELDGNIPGGCPTVEGPGCIQFTGPPFETRAFRLGPAPAGGSSTCRVRAIPRGNLDSAPVRMFLFGDAVGLPGNAIGFDPRREREAGVIGIGLFGAFPVSVPLGPAAIAGIALSLLLVGLSVLRAREGRGRAR